MKRNRNRIIVGVAVLIAAIAAWVAIRGSRTSTFDQDYHIEDIGSVCRVYLSDKENHNVLLERTADSSQSNEPKNWYEYDYNEETFFATRPDGGIYSSTHEFVEWEKALRANKVLTEASRVDAQSPHTFASDSPWSDYQNRPNTWYGYGWFIEPKTDTTKEVIYHTGDNGGFKILAARYPEDNALVLIFANRADWDRYEVMQQVEAIFGF